MPAYLWQNFLIDSKVRTYIATKIAELYTKWWCEALVEIWPWKWSITKKIWNISPNFFIIEKDDTLKSTVEEILSNLDENINHQLIMEDVLKVDLEKILEKISLKYINKPC
jgi:16S rRNA A1518/A1519 N6-dimethyltransferase RsmA/KsgA/DIM1 with predicted DNA glycosylase/AP lyase activity